MTPIQIASGGVMEEFTRISPTRFSLTQSLVHTAGCRKSGCLGPAPVKITVISRLIGKSRLNITNAGTNGLRIVKLTPEVSDDLSG
jgi:hypothetical protein